MTFKEREEQYKQAQEERKRLIRQETSSLRRFLKWCVFLAFFPFRWLWTECHDWRFLVLFVGVVAIVGSEVWVPLVIGFIATANGNSTLATTMYSVAGVCEAFWLAPFTPFIPLCIFITIGIKALLDKIKGRKERNIQ